MTAEDLYQFQRLDEACRNPNRGFKVVKSSAGWEVTVGDPRRTIVGRGATLALAVEAALQCLTNPPAKKAADKMMEMFKDFGLFK